MPYRIALSDPEKEVIHEALCFSHDVSRQSLGYRDTYFNAEGTTEYNEIRWPGGIEVTMPQWGIIRAKLNRFHAEAVLNSAQKAQVMRVIESVQSKVTLEDGLAKYRSEVDIIDPEGETS